MADPRKNFPYLELAAALSDGGFRRNEFAHADDCEAISAWRSRHDNRDVYASVCRFEKPDRKSRFACPFFADFDAEDPSDAAPEVVKACELLAERVGISPECMELYFSGAKGFHLLVPLAVFGGGVVPQAMRIWRGMAGKLARTGVRHIDLGVYQTARVLRLVNSINTKTGLYKIPIEYKELRDLGVERIIAEAKQPRSEDSLAVVEECPQAVHWFARAVESVRRSTKSRPDRPNRPWRFQRGWRMPPCICRLEQATLPDGLRHIAYFALVRFYAWVDMHPAEAERRLRTIDRRNPIRDPDYITRVVDCGRKHAGFAGCDDEALRSYCDSRRCFRMRGKAQRRVRSGR
ncbi:MAG: hypothetical protein ACP5HU_08765 [Phycisphaerae bacterium]